MPKYRQVACLQTLALRSVGKMVTSFAPKMVAEFKLINDSQQIPRLLQIKLDFLNDLLVTHVPYYLIDNMAVEVLKAVKCLIDETKKCYYARTNMSKFLIEMNVVVNLTEIVLNNRLREIDFSKWPKIMRYVLYKNLYKMSGLEVLNLGSCLGGWKYEHDRNILNGISNMKNLRSLCLCFDCTDQIIQVLSDNCPHLQCLDVTSSRLVTDRSIPCLLDCKQLKELQLHHTSITIEGLAHLLNGLPKIQEIGKCDEFGDVVKYLHHNLNATGPFALKKIQTRDLSTENLRLFVDMFPNIECISLFYLSNRAADFTIFSSLDHLKELKLLSCAFYGDYLKQLLEVKGANIENLHLEHVEEIDYDVLVHISQFCPYLKSLVIYNCDFLSQNVAALPNLATPPFQHLERLFWMVDGALPHLEYILSNAFHIKNIHLGSSTGINHFSMVKILDKNPMVSLEELRILFSSDMNMKTVDLILSRCPNLSVLSELESWQGISVEELKEFRGHIIKNNFDLDIRPTLSRYSYQ